MTWTLVIWNTTKLDALETAIELAEAGGLTTVTWEEQERPSRFAKGKHHTWPIDEARRTANAVRADLHRNAMPNFGENKEGKEP